jgi:small subunit ribosomal protein S1
MADQENMENKDFGQMLAEFEQDTGETRREDPAVGEKVTGRILTIGEENTFVDLGAKSEGVIETAQLRDAEGNVTVNPGDSIEATVASVDPATGALMLRRRAASSSKGADMAAEVKMAWQHGIPVEGVVSAINKGGAEVQVKGVRAFCPLSQLDLRYVEDPSQFVGQRLTFRVTQFEDAKGGRRPNIILSRRALLEEEQQKRATETRSKIQVGAVLTGKVTSLATYGAFIDLGGLEGMLHVSEIGYARVAHPKEVLSVGQDVEVQVIKIEKGKDEKKPERISLSRRSLEADPWKEAASRFPEGTVVEGRVMRLETFGAFVQIAPGLEGLLHISEIGGGRRLTHPREALQLGQDIQVRVLNVDTAKRRISLGMADGSENREEVEVRRSSSRGSGSRQGSGSGSSSGSDYDSGAGAGSGGGSGAGFGSMADFFKNIKRG